MVTGTEKYYQARAQDYDKVYEKPDLVRLREWLAPALDARRALDAAFAGFFWSHVPVGLLDGFLAGLTGRLDGPATLVFIDGRYVPGSSHPAVRTPMATPTSSGSSPTAAHGR